LSEAFGEEAMPRLLAGLLVAQLLMLPEKGFCEPANAIAQTVPKVADDVALETMVEFLVPARMQVDFYLQVCAHTTRNSLFKLDDFAEFESDVPGVTEYMIAVTVAYCEKHIPPVYEDWKSKMRVRVQQAMTPDEIQKLYPVLSATVSEVNATNFQLMPGESAAKASVRHEAIWRDLVKRFAGRIEFFKQDPGNSRISAKLLTLQNEVLGGMDEYSSKTLDINSKASDAGIDAANSYAIQRGKEPFFGD
jgi:hypothetical protein